MIAVGWNNGSPNNKTGAGYGIRITRRDRDKFFDKSWESVTLGLESDEVIEVKLSPSFWEGCIELRSARIGKWMLDHGLAPWPRGQPPQFQLEPRGEKRFRLSTLGD